MRSILTALAVGLAAIDVQAASMGTIPVGPDNGVSGTNTAPGTQTWRLSLSKNKYYAVDGSGDCGNRVAVRAAGGKVLASFSVNIPNDEGPSGASFRAPYTGWYDVVVTLTRANISDSQCKMPNGYVLDAARDCPGDATTGCAIAVGQTLANLHLDYVGDTDTFRTAYKVASLTRFPSPQDIPMARACGLSDLAASRSPVTPTALSSSPRQHPELTTY